MRYMQQFAHFIITNIKKFDGSQKLCLANYTRCTVGAKGMVFQAWVDELAPLSSQWLVLRIRGANFLYCWVTDSIWLELAKSLITK